VIEPKADVGTAQSQINAAAGGNYNATISVDAKLSAAQADINAFVNKDRTTTIKAVVVDSAGRQIP
jgi:hypothetical protein